MDNLAGDFRFEFHGTFRGKQQWTCWDERTFTGPDSATGSGESKEEAYTDLLDQLETPTPEQPEVAPRRIGRLVNGGGGVEPPEYVDDFRDPDRDEDLYDEAGEA